MDLVNLSSNLGLLGFAMASVLYLLAVQKSGVTWATRSAFGLFIVATVGVSVALVGIMGEAGLLDMSGLLLASAVGWLAVAGHLRFNLKMIGAFVAPLATFILLVQFFLVPRRVPGAVATTDSLLLKSHVTAAVLGQAFAIIACAISVLYLWQQNLLKKKLLDQLPKNVPAIDKLDLLLMLSLWAGFIFLTFGLLSGAIFVQFYAMPDQGLWLKTLWAVLVWAWYLAILLARNVFNRPSKRIAQMSLAGFVLLAFSYFGMGFFRPMGGP